MQHIDEGWVMIMIRQVKAHIWLLCSEPTGDSLPRVPVTLNPCWRVGWCGHPRPTFRTRRCFRPVFCHHRGEHRSHECQTCHDIAEGQR